MSAILNEDRKVDLLAFDDEFDSKGDVAHIEDNVEVTESATLSPPVLSHFAYTPQAPFIRKFWRLFVIGLCVNLCAMYTGYTLSAPGSIIANEGFIEQFATQTDPTTGAPALDATIVGLWSSLTVASSIITQFLGPSISDRFGLKIGLYCLTVLMALAIVVEIIAKDWKVFLVAKLLSGLSSGFLGPSVLAYASEITTPQMRGIHLASFSFFNALGQLFVAIGLQILQKSKPLAFRNIFYSEFAILGVWLPICLLLPESPVFLCKKGKHEQGKRSLRRLIGNVKDFDVEHEYAAIAWQVAESEHVAKKASSIGWVAVFRGTNLRRILVSAIPYNFQNFVGSPLVFGYSTYFFQLAGMEDAFQGNLIIYCVLLFGILLSFYLVDKVGRRPLLFYGGIVLAASCFIIGGLGSVSKTVTKGSGIALIAVSCIWVFAYALSVAPLGYSTLVELSTPLLRNKTAGTAAAIQSVGNTVFYYIVPILLSDQKAGWGMKIGFFFGGLAALGLVIIWFFFPESKGRSYPELDELFDRKIPAWRFASTKTMIQAQREEAEAAAESRQA